MASPAIQRQSTLQRLSTFKDRTTPTTATAHAPTAAASPRSSSCSSPLDSFASFASDPIFSTFLSPDFDSTRFSSAALASGSATSRAKSLQDAIRQLKKQLLSEVLSRHTDLLSQLSSLHHAESSLFHLRSSLSTLQSSLHQLRSEISDPNRQIRSKTVQLSNLR